MPAGVKMPARSATTRSMFFYGTLMDAAILEAVLGRVVAAGDRHAAVLEGWERLPVAGRPYPMLARRPDARVEGLLVVGLTPRDRKRLDRYEGPEYRVETLEVRTADGPAAAAVYLCRPGIRPGAGSWDMEAWRRRHRAATLAHIRSAAAGPA